MATATIIKGDRMEKAAPTAAKLGIKIEKPKDVKIHGLYPLLLVLSLVLIGGTAWFSASEYLEIPPPAWLRSVLENFVLTF